MKKAYLLTLFALLTLSALASAKEARLIRYPNYHQGRVTFSYLGDVWVADEDGRNVQRLTVNRARDVYPRFSPDGKWIAFSSDRNGNLDVYVIPPAMRPRVVLRYGDARDLLVSGLLDQGGELAQHAAVLDVPVERGHVLLFSNNPVWRGETHGSYFLVFNAILNFDNLNAGRKLDQK